jgi:hypothetical protein
MIVALKLIMLSLVVKRDRVPFLACPLLAYYFVIIAPMLIRVLECERERRGVKWVVVETTGHPIGGYLTICHF